MARGKRSDPVGEATDALVDEVAGYVAEGLGEEAPKRGRPRKPKVKDTLRSYSEAEKDQARQRLCDAHDMQLSTHGLLRNQAKEVTKAIAEVSTMTGEPKKSVRWGLENRKRPPAEIDSENRSRTRIAKFFGLAIGTQIGMFDDGKSVADKVELADAQQVEHAKDAGYAAGKAGADLEHNHAEGSPAALAFEVEWRRGQRENLSTIGTGPQSEPAHA